MAKYIIDIPEKEMMYLNTWEYKDGKCVWVDSCTASDLRPYTTSESYIDGLRKGRDEVWDFLKALYILSDEELYEIFPNGCAYEMTYSEAKARYKEWKKQKDEIHVGDEVIPLETQYDTMVVTKLWVGEFRDEWVDAIANDGKFFSFLKTSIKKTGRHFNEVEELLKKIKG